MHSLALPLLLLTLVFQALPAQEPAAPVQPATAASTAELPPTKWIAAQFGPNFTPHPDFPTPYITDLDGDGVNDAVLVAKGEKALLGQEEFNYRVLDPHHTYFGFGDPRVTSEFNIHDERSKFLLIIHGAGEEAWRAAAPKAKYVLINVPFDRLAIERFKIKKKFVNAISAEESVILTSMVYWDGKKYRWEPNQAMQ